MSQRSASRLSRLALGGFVVAGSVALLSGGLGFARIVHPMTYPHPLLWIGQYVGPLALFVASVASLFGSWRDSPSPLLAGTAVYLTAYTTSDSFGLSTIPYFSLTIMLLYGLAMVGGGIWWTRIRRAPTIGAAAV